MAKKKSQKKLSLKAKTKQYLAANWFYLLVLFVSVFIISLFFSTSNVKSHQISHKKFAALTGPKRLYSVASSSARIASRSGKLRSQTGTNTSRPSGLYGIPILMYHYIGNNPNPADKGRDSLSVPPDKFEAQMDYLAKNGFTPLTLDTLYGIFNKQVPAPAKPIVLTFDDGYIDFYINAFPILRRFNFHAVEFIPTGLIGGSYYMTWDQIKEIQSSGLVAFEAHTINHVNLPSLSYDTALKQMLDSKNILAAQTGYPVNFIAYPFGLTDDSVQAGAKAAGFTGGLGTWSGLTGGPSFNMPRIRISGSWSIADFAARI